MKTDSRFWTIAKREYLNIVKSKGFIIGTFLVPIFWLALIIIPGLLASYSFDKTEMKIAIIDKTTKKIGTEIAQADPNVFFLDTLPENTLNSKILKEELDAYIIIDDNNIKNNYVNVFTKGGGGIGFITKIENVVGKIIRKQILQESGLSPNLIQRVEADLKVETKKVTKEGIKEDYSTFYSLFGYFAGIILFMLIFLYGGLVMRGVVEEKANRIVEILLSSVKPFDIMLGKVIGLGSVGITQILIWIVLLMLIGVLSPQIISLFSQTPTMGQDISQGLDMQNPAFASFKIPPIATEFVIFFVVFFLLGYFLIASIYAGIGSAVDQEQDAQSLITPVNLVFLLPIILINLIVANPNGLASILLSLFPPFTPVLMIARMSGAPVPLWQLLLSVLLMLLSIWIALRISAKIYRVGVLIYGKKPSFKEIYRWLRQA